MPADESPQPGPERIDFDAFADAIVQNVGQEDDGDFREIVGLATKELLRRFKEEPEDLPGTFVIKLVLDGLKAIAAKDVPETSEGEDTRSIIDTLHALPPEHARKLLQREIDRMRGELARYTEKLEELA
jgi:hypothetical protein